MRFLFLLPIVVMLGGSPALAQSSDPQAPAPALMQAAPTLFQSGPVLFQAAPAPQKEQAPEHVSTSWKTLAKDSVNDYISFPQRKSTWVILAIGAGAALAVHPADDYVSEHIYSEGADTFFSAGQVIGSAYFQVGSAVGLWAVGRYIVPPATGEARTNKVSEIGFDLLRAQMLSQGLVHGIKYTAQRDRPTGECCAFPSGHAASAFAAAAVLERHFGYRLSWPALVGATYVGASRLVDNRHFLSDVMFGAALGTASGWTVVGRRGRAQITMQPVPVKGGMMIAFMKTPPQTAQ